MQYMIFCVWLFAFSKVLSRFFCVVVHIHTSFLSVAKYYSIGWLYYLLFLFSSVDEHLCGFLLLDTMNNAAVNIHV